MLVTHWCQTTSSYTRARRPETKARTKRTPKPSNHSTRARPPNSKSEGPQWKAPNQRGSSKRSRKIRSTLGRPRWQSVNTGKAERPMLSTPSERMVSDGSSSSTLLMLGTHWCKMTSSYAEALASRDRGPNKKASKTTEPLNSCSSTYL